jgi:hypothetical protein
VSNALEAAGKLRDFLAGLKKNTTLSESKLTALDEDSGYVEKCLTVLSVGETEAVNNLWIEVQHMSRFFGGDYAQGSNGRQLTQLIDEFHAAVFELVVSLRSRKSAT